jgi:uncharacterized protein
MQLDNAFTVTAPIDEVWTTLMEFDRVARCVPGAEVVGQLSDDVYQVAMRVKLGPMTMQYGGELEVIERDEEAHRAVLRGKAKEARGQGNADATAELKLSQEGEQVRGTVHADVRLLGRAAAMGQGVITSVADQILAQFAKNLQAMLNQTDEEATVQRGANQDVDQPTADDRSGATVAEAVETAAAGTEHAGVIADPEDTTPGSAPVEQTGGDAAMTEGQVVSGPGEAGGPEVDGPSVPPHEAAASGGAQSMPGARVSDRISGSHRASTGPRAGGTSDADDGGPASLDMLGLAGGILGDRLRQPRVAAGLLVTGLLAAFLLGRRAGRRTSGGDHMERLLDLLESRHSGA